MRGKAMTVWLRVAPEGVKTKRQLERWVARGVERPLAAAQALISRAERPRRSPLRARLR
jgi:hypothetical protein